MEAIKKLLRPGAAEDDNTLYGQENTANTTDAGHQKTGLTGEGSHLSSTQDQPGLSGKHTSTVPDSTTQHTGVSTGQGSHFSGARDSTTLGQSQSAGIGHGSHDPSSITRDNTRQNEGLTGQGSHLSGATDSTTTGQHQSTGLGHGSLDPGATRPIGGGSGLGHGQHERSDPANRDTTALGGSSGLSGDHSRSTNTTQGPHSSDMMNKLDPKVDSDQSRTTRTSDQTGNYASTGAGAGAGLGHREHEHSTDASRGNTSLPGYGVVQGQTATGPHSTADSSFSNTRRAADEAGNRGGAGAGMTTSGNREHDYSTGNSRGNPILGQSAQSSTTQGPHSSDMMNKLDPRVDSDNSKNINSGAGYSSTTGGSHQTGGMGSGAYSSTTGGSHHTGTTGSGVSGPHQTTTANLLDPHVNTTGRGHEDAIRHHERHGGGAEEADNDHRDAGKKAAVAGAVGLGAIGMASDNHQSRFTERGADGTVGGHPSLMPGSFPAESAHLTGGDSQHGSQNVSAIPDRTRTTNDPTSSLGEKEHHYGRDAALAGGAAGLGGAAYGSSKHSDNKNSEPVHNSSMLNRADPRVSTDNSGTAYGTNPTDRSHGIMTGNTTSHQSSQATPGSSGIDNVRGQDQHHHGRDTALGAGAAGAGYGLGRQHESHPQDTSSTTTSHQSSQTNPGSSNNDNIRGHDHHHGRDAALGAGAAGAAYEAGRQHESRPQDASTTTTSHQSSQATPGSLDNDNVRGHDHHHGRDAALGAGAAGAAYGAGRQHESHPQGASTTTTTTTSTSNTGPHTSTTGAHTSTTGPHSSDMLNRADPRVDSDRSREQGREQGKDHNYGRDAALVGGAGAAAAVGARQLDDRDEKEMKNAQKQHDKAVHDHDKHEKDRAHQQKEHDKAVLAAEKERHHREREHEKQLKDNEKRDVKDEKHEKEHKGLFSFLHRDKSKKYTQEEEDDFARQERDYNSSASANTLVGAAQIGGSSLGDKLHGTARNRGIIGESGFPHGDGPHVDVNQHTGESFSGPSVASHQTAPHTGVGVTGAHQNTHGNTAANDDLTHSHSRTGAMGEGKQSVNEYNSSGGRQGDILSPTTDSYTTSGTGHSTTHHSSGADTAPRHLTSEQKAHGSGSGVLESDSGVKTTQGVHAGESHGTGVAAGSDGRNRLHKDPPAGQF